MDKGGIIGQGCISSKGPYTETIRVGYFKYLFTTSLSMGWGGTSLLDSFFRFFTFDSILFDLLFFEFVFFLQFVHSLSDSLRVCVCVFVLLFGNHKNIILLLF